MKFTTAEIEILIDVLAKTNAVFEAPRGLARRRGSQKIARGQRSSNGCAFGVEGIALVQHGTAEERKRFERQLGAMQSRGLIDLFAKSGRRIGISLTEFADDIARHLCAMPLLHESWPILQRVKNLIDAGCSVDRRVREVDILAVEYGSVESARKLSNLELFLLPAKVRGWIGDTADGSARIWYLLTTAGEGALCRPAPEKPRGLPRYNSRAGWCDRYLQLAEGYIASRSNWTPRWPNFLVLPVPEARLWPERAPSQAEALGLLPALAGEPWDSIQKWGTS